MSGKFVSQFHDFSLGINVQDAANLIPDNALTEAQNAIVGRGFVAKRHGYEMVTSAPIERTLLWNDIGSKKWSDV